MILWQITSHNGDLNTMVLTAGSEVKCCGEDALFLLLYNRIIIPEEHIVLARLMILVQVQFVIPSRAVDTSRDTSL